MILPVSFYLVDPPKRVLRCKEAHFWFQCKQVPTYERGTPCSQPKVAAKKKNNNMILCLTWVGLTFLPGWPQASLCVLATFAGLGTSGNVGKPSGGRTQPCLSSTASAAAPFPGGPTQRVPPEWDVIPQVRVPFLPVFKCLPQKQVERTRSPDQSKCSMFAIAGANFAARSVSAADWRTARWGLCWVSVQYRTPARNWCWTPGALRFCRRSLGMSTSAFGATSRFFAAVDCSPPSNKKFIRFWQFLDIFSDFSCLL